MQSKHNYVCINRCYINEKLYVSAGSGHHQIFLRQIKIVLYISRDGVLMCYAQRPKTLIEPKNRPQRVVAQAIQPQRVVALSKRPQRVVA